MKKAIASVPAVPTGSAAKRLAHVKEVAHRAASAGGHAPPRLIAISKTHDTGTILPFLEAGHRIFGENRVQEAAGKWPDLKTRFPEVELHLVGQLQSNKAKEAVELFDAIHSVDRPSLVKALARVFAKTTKRPLLFTQVNLGQEPQKGGIPPEELPAFLETAKNSGLDISGLMVIPPADKDPAPYFALLAKLAKRHELAKLSMGMSSDYDLAANLGSSHVRIGSALFGERK